MVTAPECEGAGSDDVVGELGVGGHTVVRGWVWPGSQRLANQRQGAWPGAVNHRILVWDWATLQ